MNTLNIIDQTTKELIKKSENPRSKNQKGGEMKLLNKIDQTGKELIEKSENPIVVVNIPDDVIDVILEIGDQVALWAKPTETGFSANDKIIEEIIGRIVKMKIYGVKWTDKQPHKIPINPDEDLPEGYEPRCDLFVDVGGQVIAISLSKSSLKFHLSPYVRSLKNNGLRPEDVISRLRVKQATNRFGSFNLVIFDVVDRFEGPPPCTASAPNPPPVSAPPLSQGTAITQAADSLNPWA